MGMKADIETILDNIGIREEFGHSDETREFIAEQVFLGLVEKGWAFPSYE